MPPVLTPSPVAEIEVAGAREPAAGPRPLRAPRVRCRRKNHWAKHAPDEFVCYPKSEELTYLNESRLVRRAQAGDTDARNRLWVQHLRLVLSVANRFHIPEALLPAALQEGALGIKEAIEKFEVERCHCFSTYAWRWIYQRIQRFLTANLFPTRLPGRAFSEYLRFRRELRAAGTRDGERRVCERWRAADRKTYRRVLRVYALTQALPAHLLDRATEPGASDVVPTDEIDWKGLVAGGLLVLTERQRDVIVMRYGLGGEPPKTLAEVGDRYGVTKERIRQIRVKAEERLRRHLKGDPRLPFDGHTGGAKAKEN